ncbi:uncharacterized protein PV09_09215 [Verruconis gallopava]|uniref:ER-bound oxygenase mpaB/mpaB'/Rubber oxygenase catalytic domain-containing protein n=1 Tax=Verruconis gallopava TaxID=253628 RepID=A0A0D1XA66_9PEZI|nr:uncharacterized protein PV09_09215 [Verruconis gallopava]KIV99040.1 hypothetical protein PV09_09215 [Verruconis gallopava]
MESPKTKPKLGQKFHCYGISFKWTSLHKSAEELNKLVFTYDKLATDTVNYLQENATSNKDVHGRDLFKLLKDEAEDGGVVGQLWDQVNTVPEWVDWQQIERGQKVFWRYVGPALVALGQMSLLGSFGYGRAVRVLDKTGGWKTENTFRRLLETTQHTLDVHKDLKSLQPGGDGWESSIRVRLLHSSVRRRIMALAREKPEYYDKIVDGVPINDMDSIITMNDFSSLVMYLGLPRQGIYPSKQEIADYLATWRYICYIMGTPDFFLETPESAKAMMESIFLSEVKPDEQAGVISNNMINALVGQAPSYASRGFLQAMVYWLNGKEIARSLEIEAPSLYHTSLVAGQCWLFMLLTYPRRFTPTFIDDRINEATKKKIYDALVHNKEKGALGYKAKFTFKWIPALDFRTPPGDTKADRTKDSGALKHFGPEAVSIVTLLMTAFSAAGGVWGAFSTAKKFGLLPAWPAWLPEFMLRLAKPTFSP